MTINFLKKSGVAIRRTLHRKKERQNLHFISHCECNASLFKEFTRFLVNWCGKKHFMKKEQYK